MEKKNKFRDYRMVGLSVKAVISAVPIAAVYVMAYLFLSSLSGAVTGLLLEKLTNAVLLKERVYIVYIVVYVSFFVLLQLAGFAYAIAMNTFVFEKVSDELNRRLADAMVRIEYFDLEKKEKLDAIYRARECIEDERIPGCFMQTVMLAGTIVALVSSFFVAGSWNGMIPVILVLFFIPEMLIRKKAVKAEQTEKEKTVKDGDRSSDVGAAFACRRASCVLWTARSGMSGAENPGGRTGRCAVAAPGDSGGVVGAWGTQLESAEKSAVYGVLLQHHRGQQEEKECGVDTQ